MNITRENIDNVNAVIKILIEKADYEKTVEEKLKEYQKKSSIPGFRPGKAPLGLIKKRVGKAILLDEVNNMLSQNLTKYLMEENLNILGEPLPNKDQQKEIDFDKDENFEFAFDIALSPDINVPLGKNDKLPYYTIKVSDEMIDKQVEMISSQMGQNIKVDEVKEKCLVRGDFRELAEEGEEKEDGINPEGIIIAVDTIKDDDIKKQFIGKSKDDVIIFNPVTAFNDRKEVGHLLNIGNEEAEKLESIFKYKITEILEFQKAELNEDLFKKLFGEDTEIKTGKDLREKIKNEIASNLMHSSERKFIVDVRKALLEKIDPKLPEAFLKRWLKATNNDVSEEDIEKDFNGFAENLKWQLIVNSITKENELNVDDDEAFEFAKELAYAQYSQYGMPDAPEDHLESFARMILDKPEEKEKLYDKLIEIKVIKVIKDKITLQNKEVTEKEFTELANT
jgi:trigger factor